VTLSNTGTADLVFAVTDDAMPSINGTQTIPVGGAPVVLTGTIAVPAGASSVANEVKVVITLDERYKLDNTYTESRTATCQSDRAAAGNQAARRLHCEAAARTSTRGRVHHRQTWDRM
jgi:hypothetical protein